MPNFSIIAILLQFLTAVSSLKNLCPPYEDLKPCGCVSDGRSIRVDCMSVTSVEDVRKALQSIKGMKRVYIDFLRARLDKIPSDLFKGLDAYKISFTNCDLKQFGDEGRSALEGLENIIEEFSIHFSFSEENELKFLNVSGLKVIEDLEIEGNGLTKMGNEWFRDGPVNLKNLFIMTNFIEELGDKAFASLINLKNLWLTGNQIQDIQRSMFPSPANHLQSLDLTDNGLTSLPGDIFSDMPVLKEVVLTENDIKKLPQNTWFPAWRQLTRVYLDENPLECDSHIEWMFEFPRPMVLKGKCVAPPERKDQDLKRIIDDKAMEDEDDF